MAIYRGVWGDGISHIDTDKYAEYVDRSNIMQQNKYLEEINVEDENMYR